MCGICGKFDFSGAIVDKSLIRKMCETVVHRGPDDEGIYSAPYIGLGQKRLSIIDLRPLATPPLSNEDGSLWVVFNGEIYNFREEREDLTARGHVFRTESDTEVILHLYEEYGTECLKRLRGMFAFALWDSRKKSLFAARDRLGKKPFFYTRTPYAFLFGSEIKAITADNCVSISPNYTAIDRYLTYQYVPSPLTAFTGIFKLPPGNFLICNADGSITVQRYWNSPIAGNLSALQPEIEEELVRLLREAVRIRMVADVPLGAFLSGGIDSATIVSLMAQESGRPIKTYSIGVEEEAYNELPYAHKVAKLYGTDHHEFVIKPDAEEILPLLVRHYNEPFADSSALPTYYLSKLTRQNVTVALCGDGGDENFSGYDHYRAMNRWTIVDSIPFTIRSPVKIGMEKILEKFPYSNAGARFSRGLNMLGSRFRERYILHMTLLKPQEKRICYTRRYMDFLAQEVDQEDPVSSYEWDDSMDPLSWMMRHDQNFYLPDCLMVKTDVASMANSLEIRSPFLDHLFVEFAAGIPSYLKRNGTVGKIILKSAVRELLPTEILQKPKTGFSVPLAKWFRGKLSDLLHEVLLDEKASRRGLFESRFVKKMVDEQIENQRDWSNRLWAFLCLELWFREFVD